jgi:hypothetical protein
LVILPALMQDVQTLTRCTPWLTTARTVCKLGLKRRLVRLLAWLTRLPNIGPLLQISQRIDIVVTLPFLPLVFPNGG